MTMQHILLAVLAAVFSLSVVPARAEMKNQWVEYSHGETKLKAYMVYDDKVTGRRPAVFVVHAREGMTPKTLQLTETWAKLGYVSFATDIFGYGQGVLPKNFEEMTAPRTRAIRSRWSTRWSRSCAPRRSPSSWRSTAAPATASPPRRTRPRSAPTRSRSTRPRARSRRFSACERSPGTTRNGIARRPTGQVFESCPTLLRLSFLRCGSTRLECKP